jgi:serine/threonine protein kinase
MSARIELIKLDGSRMCIAMEVQQGAVIMSTKMCSVSSQMNFPVTSVEEHVEKDRDGALDDLIEAVRESETSTLVLKRHRGLLSVHISLGTKTHLYSFPKEPSAEILKAADYHYSTHNFGPIRCLVSEDLDHISPGFSFLPKTKVNSLFQNNFWTDIFPGVKLKLDIFFSSSSLSALTSWKSLQPSEVSSMSESPMAPNKIDVLHARGELLGEGTFGKVYEVECEGRLYALKCLRREGKEEFGGFLKSVLSETSGLASCAHDFDVRLKDADTIQVLMPFYGRKNVESFISSRRQRGLSLNIDQHLGIFRGIARTLGHLHSKGIAHLDIKLANIIGLSETNSCELVDFGLSSLQEGPQKDVLKITLDTRDPVVIEGKECFTWSDIWSLGVIFSDLVSDKRFSIIPYMKPGTWDNGKAYNWLKEEKELCLKFIGEKVNDDLNLGAFLRTLLCSDVSTLSIGMAYVLSCSLWKNPGKRSTFGFFSSSHVSLEKWPFPVFCHSPLTTPTTESLFLNFTEQHIGHYSLDGSGPYRSLHTLPALPQLRHAVCEHRRFQLQFISALLLDVREFNLKTLLLAVDVLDRVSSPKVREHIHATYPDHSFFLLEVVCTYFALLQSCAQEPGLDFLVKKAMENLPYGSNVKEPNKEKVWTVFRSLLSTVKFQQYWEDGLWPLVVKKKKFRCPAYIRGLLEALHTWPNGSISCESFLDSIQERSICTLFSSSIPVKKFSLQSSPSWITPEFQLHISQTSFLEAYVHSDFPRQFGDSRDMPKEHQNKEVKSGQEGQGNLYAFLKEQGLHPFYVTLQDSMLSYSREDFAKEVEAYIQEVASKIPESVTREKSCVACSSAGSVQCSSCKLWHLCTSCEKKWEGRCSQCLFPHETEDWKQTFQKGYGISLWK